MGGRPFACTPQEDPQNLAESNDLGTRIDLHLLFVSVEWDKSLVHVRKCCFSVNRLG